VWAEKREVVTSRAARLGSPLAQAAEPAFRRVCVGWRTTITPLQALCHGSRLVANSMTTEPFRPHTLPTTCVDRANLTTTTGCFLATVASTQTAT
jgi:hypothetical protein